MAHATRPTRHPTYPLTRPPTRFRTGAVLAVLAASTVACLEPPPIDRLAAPVPGEGDTGAPDTWGPLDPAQSSPESEPPESPDPDPSPPFPDAGGPPADPDMGLVAIDPGLAQLRLTEVLLDPEGADGGVNAAEIVELQNLGDGPVILSGLAIDAASWPALDATDLELDGVELGAGDYLVLQRWAIDTEPAEVGVRVEPGVVWVGFRHSGGLRNTDGSVEILAGAQSVDRLDYGPELPTQTPGAGLSLCRPPTEGLAWQPCLPSPGLPEQVLPSPAEPTPIPPGALVIVEVLANPPGPASGEKSFEYVEIINTSENSVELAGLRIADAPGFDAPGVDPLEPIGGDGGCDGSACLAPGARALLVAQGYLGPTGDALVLATDDTTLADGGLTNTEPVTLWAHDGQLLSSYRLWPDPSGDPVPLDELPLHRLEPSAEDLPGAWISAPASPGT